MTLGAFVAFVSYNESLAWPVRSLGRVLSDMSKAGVSMDRVGYILRSPEEQDQPDDVPFPGGDIVFDHVTFGYEGQPVLKDVSFTIREGETFAVLGGTGSGKSTLVHLLDRLYDVPGGLRPHHHRRRGPAAYPAQRPAAAHRSCFAGALPVLPDHWREHPGRAPRCAGGCHAPCGGHRLRG